ncbi:hypothetical protein MKX03_035043 [Papaver bracteatum]|nr:hypothetical protein MKX03_035043 [Papaver bracteatum]
MILLVKVETYPMDLVKGRLIVQVVSTLAEIFWEQLKCRHISSMGRTSKVQQPSSSQSMEDVLPFLDGTDAKENDCFVYAFIIHNIDGPGLRDSESQQYLTLLASCSNICVVASIDHVNTVLCLAVSPQHTYMFFAGDDKQVKCWDHEQNKVIRSYYGHHSGVYCVVLRPTIDVLLTGGCDSVCRMRKLKIMDLSTLRRNQRSKMLILRIDTLKVNLVEIDPEGALEGFFEVVRMKSYKAEWCHCNRNLGWLNPASDKVPNKFRKLVC